MRQQLRLALAEAIANAFKHGHKNLPPSATITSCRAPPAPDGAKGAAACTSSHGSSASTARMNESVQATDRLKLRKSPLSLAWMNASMSG